MIGIGVSQVRVGRGGRPLVFSLAEAAVLALVAIALIATAAVPAAVRHPRSSAAKAIAGVSARP